MLNSLFPKEKERNNQTLCPLKLIKKDENYVIFSIHDPINRVDKEAFEVMCPVHQEIREAVKRNLEKCIEKMKKKIQQLQKS